MLLANSWISSGYLYVSVVNITISKVRVYNDNCYQERIMWIVETMLDLVLNYEASDFKRPFSIWDDSFQVVLHQVQWILCCHYLALIPDRIIDIKLNVDLFLFLEFEDLFSQVEVAGNGSFGDGKLGREIANMVQSKLPVNFLGYFWHVLETVQRS